MLVFHNVRECVIYSSAHIKYYTIRRLKNYEQKRARREASRPQMVRLALSQGQPRGPQFGGRVLAAPVQHGRAPEPALGFKRESAVQHRLPLLFLLSVQRTTTFRQVSFQGLTQLSLLHFHAPPQSNHSLPLGDNHLLLSTLLIRQSFKPNEMSSTKLPTTCCSLLLEGTLPPTLSHLITDPGRSFTPFPHPPGAELGFGEIFLWT